MYEKVMRLVREYEMALETHQMPQDEPEFQDGSKLICDLVEGDRRKWTKGKRNRGRIPKECGK